MSGPMRKAVAAALAAVTATAGYTVWDVYRAVNPVFEGRRYEAYLDRLPSIPVPTICEGWTHGVEMGDVATDEQCDQYTRLSYEQALAIFERWVPRKVREAMDPVSQASFLLFLTNVGPGGKGVKDGFVWLKSGRHSTMLLRLRAGDVLGACAQLPSWANAGGRRIEGLANRRNDEKIMCEWPPTLGVVSP